MGIGTREVQQPEFWQNTVPPILCSASYSGRVASLPIGLMGGRIQDWT